MSTYLRRGFATVGAVEDLEEVEAQIQRKVRGASVVVRRCHLGLPVVIRVAPLLEDGTPFPTRYWLTCPLAVWRVGKLEAACKIRSLSERVARDEEFARRLAEAHSSYAAERDADIPPDHRGPRPSGGVGGASSPWAVKCLHAHYAHHAAGFENPVGEEVALAVEPLDCEVPCVEHGKRNPLWRRPAGLVEVPGPASSAAARVEQERESCGSRHRD